LKGFSPILIVHSYRPSRGHRSCPHNFGEKEEVERVKKSFFLANRRRYAQIPDSKFHATFWGLAIL